MRKSLIAFALASGVAPSPAATPQTAVLDMQNMICSLCPIAVKKALEKVPGVSQAQIDFQNWTATVTFDADKVTAAGLVKATADAGFPSTVRK